MLLKELVNKRDKEVASLQYSQIARAASVFVVSIFLAKIFDDIELITEYETLLLIGGSFTFFWVSALLTTFLPFYHSASDKDKAIVIFNTFLILSLLSLLTLAAILLFAGYFFSLGDPKILLYFSLFILFNSPSFFTEYVFLIKKKNRLILVYASLFYSLHVVAVCLPLLFKTPLLVSIKLLALLGLIKYILAVFVVIKNSKPGFHYGLTKQYILKSLPISASFLVGGSAEYIDGFIVKYFSDNTGFALYRYGARELPLTLLFANAMSNVMSGKIAAAIGEGIPLNQVLANLKKSSLRLMHFLFPLTIVLLLISPWLFDLFYNDIIQPAYKIFNLFLLLIVSRLIFPHSIILGMQKTRIIFWTSLIASVMNIGLSILFIQKQGIIGVAYATLIAHYFHKIMMIFIVHQKSINLSQYIPLVWWVIYSTVVWIVFVVV